MKMAKDLRSFLLDLESNHPEEKVVLETEISTKWEVTALQVCLERQGKFPVIIAHAPRNAEGAQTPYRLITNVLASRHRCAEAIGVGSTEVAKRYTEKSNAKRDPVVVPSSEAPVQGVVYEGDRADLSLFPIVWHHALDPGPYITAGFFTTVDPDSGAHNSSLQRCWVKARNRTGVFPNVGSDNWINLQRWWERGENAPVAVWVGHHPAAYLGCQSYGRIAYADDHYPYVGGVLGEPLRLVPTRTHGKRVKVPADAEVVIEGFCRRYLYEAEGPFGERPGYTGGQRPNPVIEVSAVTCRKDAYWQDILVGHPDNFVAGGFAIESQVYERLKRLVPEVVNVHMPISAGCRDHVYIQIKKTHAGSGRDAAAAALTCTPKHAFIFDNDVDIFNERQVLWAIATRSQWDRDLIVVPGLKVSPLDPSVPGIPGIGAKAALDCTMPPPPEPGMPPFYPPTNRVPEDVLERLDLTRLIRPDKLNRIPTE
jgi:2,5-furandicarboxylate decarboxylase 1